MKNFTIIAAMDCVRGIGKGGRIPWDLPEDLKRFHAITTKGFTHHTGDDPTLNAVIMGRKTYQSIIDRNGSSLGQRINIVMSRSKICSGNQFEATAHGLNEALEMASSHSDVLQVFVIGGGEVYREAIQHPNCTRIYLTRVEGSYNCDTFFPEIPGSFKKTAEALHPTSIPCSYLTYERMPHELPHTSPVTIHDEYKLHEEHQYLNLVREALAGAQRDDRTGTGTVSVFGRQMRFSMRDGTLPLFTTKRVFWRGVVEELLWMIRGGTNTKSLTDRGVHIWDANGKKEFLEKRGLDYPEGELGPVYGFQWRHCGAEYAGAVDYTGQGVDQLQEVIQTIRTNPTSRRIILSAWNVQDLPKMALPPCHMTAQFYVSGGELSCMMTQRSADLGLGVPFNVASYSLLTCMIAHVCGLRPGELIHNIGDAHVYLNHVEAMREQCSREPRPFPQLRIKRPVASIDGFTAGDFDVTSYDPHPKIDMTMSV
jgi:dihydrofolate reductase / thymidylate synthase